jgi:hypothetical protein
LTGLRTFWRSFLGAIPTIAQVSIILAALAFLQQQEPLVTVSIDHQTKELIFKNNGLVPVSIQLYAVQFDLNFLTDPAHHMTLDKDKPIATFSTRGPLPSFTVWPLTKRTRDLKKSQLDFDEWNGKYDGSNQTVYCIAFEKSSWLGKSSSDVALTPKLKFSASLFGRSPPSAGMGGGFPLELFAVERQIKDGCLTLFDKFS